MVKFEGQKILVVEDNRISFKLIEVHLKNNNLSIVHAADGEQAIERFNTEKDIDLILMDIQLPHLNGLEVTKLIREINPDIPIIATTANAFDEDRVACENAGCTNFVTKPIDFPALFILMNEYLH